MNPGWVRELIHILKITGIINFNHYFCGNLTGRCHEKVDGYCYFSFCFLFQGL